MYHLFCFLFKTNWAYVSEGLTCETANQVEMNWLFHPPPSTHPSPVVPSWVLAYVGGLYGAYKLYSLGPSTTGSLSYAITFAMYAAMISSGLVVHCLFLVECGQAAVTQVHVQWHFTSS